MSNRQGSARVTLNEIDRSDVSSLEQLPVGVPAAVVGPSRRGPAFVPKTFATMEQFNKCFGSMQEVHKDSNSNKFGPLALNEWMRQAQAGTYLRVLGVGDDAGFVVGNQVSYDGDDKLQDNPHAAKESGEGLIDGDTYFLGCFMKDTNESTYLKDSGVTTESTSGVLTYSLKNGALPTIDDTFKIKHKDDVGVDVESTITFVASAGNASQSTKGTKSVESVRNLSQKIDALTDLTATFIPTRFSDGEIAKADAIPLNDGGGDIAGIFVGATYKIVNINAGDIGFFANISTLGAAEAAVGGEFVLTSTANQGFNALTTVKLVEDLDQASLEIRSIHSTQFPSSNSFTVDYNITNSTSGGSESDITVQDGIASSERDFFWGLDNAVAAEFTISSRDGVSKPKDDTSIKFFGLKNEGDGTFTIDGNHVTYEFDDTAIAADVAGADDVANRYEVTSANAVTIYSGGTIKETLLNLKSAIDRTSIDDHTLVHRGLFETTISPNGLSLRIVSVYKGNAGIKRTNNTGNIVLKGAVGENSLIIECASDADTNLTNGTQQTTEDFNLVSTQGEEDKVKFMKNGRDADPVSFDLSLSGQPNNNDVLELQTVNNAETDQIDKEKIKFTTSSAVTNASVNTTDSTKATASFKFKGNVSVDGKNITALTDLEGTTINVAFGIADANVSFDVPSSTLTIGFDVANDSDANRATRLIAGFNDLSNPLKITAIADPGNDLDKVIFEQDLTGEYGSEVADFATDAGVNAEITQFSDNNGLRVTNCKIGSDILETLYNLKNCLISTSVQNLKDNLVLFESDNVTPLDIVSDSGTISLQQASTEKGVRAKLKNKLSATSTVTISNSEGEVVVGNFGKKQENFVGGGGAAAPLVRGVLMVPQGVVPALANTTFNQADTDSRLNVAVTSSGALKNFASPDVGDDTKLIGYELGEIADDTQAFSLLLNGFNNSSELNTLSCSFDPESPNYFAKVLNTDPTKIEKLGHYLYLNWDIDKACAVPSNDGVTAPSGAAIDVNYAFCSKASENYRTFRESFKTAQSPWVISQTDQDLFKVYALDDGEVANSRFRVQISDLKLGNSASDYATFTLALERFDSDPISGEVIASWRNLTLDPDSRNYIARVIGDKHIYYNFDAAESRQRLVEEGTYDVTNDYIRVEMDPSVDAGDITFVTMPCGFRGLSYAPLAIVESGTDGDGAGKVVSDASYDRHQVLPVPYVKSIAKKSGSSKVADAKLSWGVKFAKKTKRDDEPNELTEIRTNTSMPSWTKFLPNLVSDSTADTHQNSKFSLNNIYLNLDSDGELDWSTAEYRRDGEAGSLTTQLNVGTHAVGKNSRYLKFRFMMQGGFDGLDIFNEEKSKMSSVAAFREANDETDNAKFTGVTVDSYKKAIDVLSDKSATEFQLLAVPGMREPLITDYAITACESRFDAMLLVDIEEVAEGNTLPTTDESLPNVANTINRFRNRSLDTSFAAAYFPNVIIRRPSNGTPVEVPPSVSMLGVMSQNDFLADPWFAPAGLSRGKLNALNSKVQMNRDVLDDLYDEDINQIYEPSGRPGEVYAFGQKTLLQNQSALDRINVRRLLINVRRRVKAVANTLLFEPNRASTLAKFSALVEPIMAEIQARQGVDRYKVQIDTSTTTQNDVENNTIRGKVYLQPTKSVEFISLDFVVTNSIDWYINT